MYNQLPYKEHSYRNMCYDCESALHQCQLRGQAKEFRLCFDCRKDRFEATHHGNRLPQTINALPIEQQVNTLTRQLEALKSDLMDFTDDDSD